MMLDIVCRVQGFAKILTHSPYTLCRLCYLISITVFENIAVILKLRQGAKLNSGLSKKARLVLRFIFKFCHNDGLGLYKRQTTLFY